MAHDDRPSGTSLSMLAQVRSADPHSWNRLVHLYGPLIYSWCQRAGLRAEDAADVMQEVWGAVARGITRFDRSTDGGSFRGWLYTVTHNKVRDFFRAGLGRPRAEGGSAAYSRLAEVPEDESEDSRSDLKTGMPALMRRALEMIREDFERVTFRAFWETAIDCRQPSDVAADLGVSVDTVYQAKSRVLKRLRQELGVLMAE